VGDGVTETTKPFLLFYLAVMAGMIGFSLAWPATVEGLLTKPDFYKHAKFLHILTVTLVFSNAVIGSLWELRALLNGDPRIVRYTYQNVVWLDAVFTAPLIIIAVVSGIMLGTILGGVWSMNWLALAFSLFLFSGGVWLLFDIPSQYKAKKLFAQMDEGAVELPEKLRRLLWWRMGLNVCTLIPLVVIFYLMVHKPNLE